MFDCEHQFIDFALGAGLCFSSSLSACIILWASIDVFVSVEQKCIVDRKNCVRISIMLEVYTPISCFIARKHVAIFTFFFKL